MAIRFTYDAGMAMSLETLHKLVKLDPNDPLSRFALGKKLYEMSMNLPEAADHLRFANGRDPSHLATYHMLSKVLIALGHRDEARGVMLEGLKHADAVGEGMGRDLGPAMRDLLAKTEGAAGEVPATIRLARSAEVVDLRHRVLRAGMDRSAAVFPGDDDADTLHGVAEVRGQIACCATMMLQAPPPECGVGETPMWRLRGMATDEAFRAARLGRRVLATLEAEARGRKPTPLHWCNARIGAVPFYKSQGWVVVSAEAYDIPTAGLHQTMVKRFG